MIQLNNSYRNESLGDLAIRNDVLCIGWSENKNINFKAYSIFADKQICNENETQKLIIFENSEPFDSKFRCLANAGTNTYMEMIGKW